MVTKNKTGRIMVRKLQIGEYLRRYDSMTAAERRAFMDRVGQWLRSGGRMLQGRAGDPDARLQNVLTAGASWNDAECQAFEEGARLLSALVGTADTWLPDMLYVKAAKRAIGNMTRTLLGFTVKGASAAKPAREQAAKPAGKDAVNKKRDGFKAPRKAEPEKVHDVKAGPATSVAAGAKPVTAAEAVPVRPKHIDQYVHLLPEKTQKKAARVRDLLRDLDAAREKMRLLMDAEGVKADDRAAWAKKATSLDNQIRAIYNELDAEWEKLVKSGRVTVDDLGNVRVSEVQDAPSAQEAKPELTSEQKARRRELRKWLGDKRRGNGSTRDAHVEKWKEAYREFLSLEGPSAAEDAKVAEAALHYGIDLAALAAEGKKEEGK